MSAPLRSVDGYLSRRMQHRWPQAIVYHVNRSDYVVDTGHEEIGLGQNFHEAKQAVEALLKAWQAGAPVVSPSEVIKTLNHGITRLVPKEEDDRGQEKDRNPVRGPE